jgi:hypothetical protein
MKRMAALQLAAVLDEEVDNKGRAVFGGDFQTVQGAEAWVGSIIEKPSGEGFVV